MNKAVGRTRMTDELTQHIDASLLSFLDAADDAEAQLLMGELVLRQGKPIVKRVLYRLYAKEFGRGAYLREIDDICGDVLVLLVKRLRDLKTNPEAGLINNFCGYITAVTYNVCYDHLRQKHSERWRLKNKMRYLLTHREGLTLWPGEDGGWLCGFAAWRERRWRKSAVYGEQLLRSVTASFGAARLSNSDVRGLPPAELLSHIFRVAEGPLEFEDLVGLVAELWDDVEYTEQIEADLPGPITPFDQIPDPQPGVETVFEDGVRLKQIWKEICQLPLPQRAALLLSIRDSQGRSVLTLFQITNTASMRQLAEALSMTAESFAQMWNDLPLGDATIAEYLGSTRQQVVNLRLSARKRLARRMREPRQRDVAPKPALRRVR
jgi:DNA-directed RNA polymerase specialized sigma24 family protein